MRRLRYGGAIGAATVSGLGLAPPDASAGNLYVPFYGNGNGCSGSLGLTAKEGWVYPVVYGQCSKPIARGVSIQLNPPPGGRFDQAYFPMVGGSANAVLDRQVVVAGVYRLCGYIIQSGTDDSLAGGCADAQFK